MNDKQNQKLINSIQGLDTTICVIAFISVILGSCVATIATDKISSEIRNAGHDVSYAIKHQECK